MIVIKEFSNSSSPKDTSIIEYNNLKKKDLYIFFIECFCITPFYIILNKTNYFSLVIDRFEILMIEQLYQHVAVHF